MFVAQHIVAELADGDPVLEDVFVGGVQGGLGGEAVEGQADEAGDGGGGLGAEGDQGADVEVEQGDED